MKEPLKGREADDLVLLGFAGHGVQMPLVDDEGKPVVDGRGKALSDVTVTNRPAEVTSSVVCRTYSRTVYLGWPGNEDAHILDWVHEALAPTAARSRSIFRRCRTRGCSPSSGSTRRLERQ